MLSSTKEQEQEKLRVPTVDSSEEETASEAVENTLEITLQKDDVLLGHSVSAREHPGNLLLEQLAKAYSQRWKKKEERKLANEILLKTIRPGRFLKRLANGAYVEVPEMSARMKVHHTLEKYELEHKGKKSIPKPTSRDVVVASKAHFKPLQIEPKIIVKKKSQANKFEIHKKTPLSQKVNIPSIAPMTTFSANEIIARKLDEHRQHEINTTMTNHVVGRIVELEDIPLALLKSSQVFVTYLA